MGNSQRSTHRLDRRVSTLECEERLRIKVSSAGALGKKSQRDLRARMFKFWLDTLLRLGAPGGAKAPSICCNMGYNEKQIECVDLLVCKHMQVPFFMHMLSDWLFSQNNNVYGCWTLHFSIRHCSSRICASSLPSRICEALTSSTS